jgi:hypothetical protein
MRPPMTKNKVRSLKFAVSGVLLASAPMLGCGGSEEPHVNEPMHTNEPPVEDVHTNEPADTPEEDVTTINEPAPEAE